MAMKFISNKSDLLTLIVPAMSAVSSKNTLPALEGLLFTLKDGLLTVCGYDLEKGVQTSGTVQQIAEGGVILNAQKVSAIIRNFPDCEISFETNDKYIVRISGGMSDFSIHGLAPDVFPSLPELGGERSFSIQRGLLKEMIASTHYAVAQTEARPVFTGQLFKIEGKRITLVAVDNSRLATRTEENAVFKGEGLGESYSFIVPGKALSDFSRLLDDSDELVTLEFTSKYIIFHLENTVLFSRLLEGEFLDYEKAIPKQNKISVVVETADFYDSAQRASLLVDEKLKSPLKCNFKGNLLEISCSTRYGNASDNLRIEKTGEDILIAFNSRYLLDALKVCKDEKIILELSTPLMSMIVKPLAPSETGGTYTHLVLPCRLRD